MYLTCFFFFNLLWSFHYPLTNCCVRMPERRVALVWLRSGMEPVKCISSPLLPGYYAVVLWDKIIFSCEEFIWCERMQAVSLCVCMCVCMCFLHIFFEVSCYHANATNTLKLIHRSKRFVFSFQSGVTVLLFVLFFLPSYCTASENIGAFPFYFQKPRAGKQICQSIKSIINNI